MKRRFKREELAGKTFNYLTLEELVIKENNRRFKTYWKCRCVCGTSVIRRQDAITSGRTTSCGCKHSTKFSRGKDHFAWGGYGDISGNHFSSIRNGAERRCIKFKITIEFAWNLIVKQSFKCALTGLPISVSPHTRKIKTNSQTASLDRIDSTRGYTEDNVQWIHKDINKMKNNLPQDHFIKMCHLITKLNPLPL